MTRPLQPIRVLLAPLVLAISSCGDSPPRSDQATNVGPVVVSNAVTGAWKAGEAWRVVEELRIGSAVGDGPTVFGDIVDVDVDSSGRLFVLDRQAGVVRIFGSDGEHARTIGRRGGGPGEFRQPTAIDLRRDGTIWVVDLPGNGYSVFDTTGTFIRSYPAEGEQALPWPGGFDEAGRLYDWRARFGDDGVPESLLIAYAPGDDLVPVDTVVLPLPEIEEIELAGRGSMRKPFGTQTHWHLDPRGYVWTGRDDRYRIAQLALSGDTVRVIEKQHDAAPVTRADAEAALERIAPVLARFADSASASKNIPLPKHRPAYEAFITDARGNLWVQRTLAEDRARAPAISARYDVFNAEGVYLGVVTSPIGTWEWGTKPVFRNDYMAGVVTDSFGVDYVVRARILRSR